MTNGVRIEKLTREGIALMQEERGLALKGDLAGLDALNKRKLDFLNRMEALASSHKRLALKPAQREEIETLFEIIRRRAAENQQLLQAAEAGVKAAQMRIMKIKEQEKEIGAYNKDGSPIKHTSALSSQSQIA